MDADVGWFPGHLLQLQGTECWEMLRTQEVGRVAFVDDAGPMVVPITYVVHGEVVLFRVAPSSSLARSLPGATVALETDDIDPFTRSGWNVVVRGRTDVVDPEELLPGTARPTPWPEGLRTTYLRLVPSSISGRRLLEA